MASINFKIDTRISDCDRKILRDFCSELGGDVVILAQKLGLKVFSQNLPPNTSGFIDYAPSKGTASGYIIVVNANDSVERQKFTVAHEIGHYVLHRGSEHFKKASAVGADILEFPTGNRSQGGWDYRAGVAYPLRFEREADAFAATVLLPEHLLRETPEFQNGEIVKLARRLKLSVAMVSASFEDAIFG